MSEAKKMDEEGIQKVYRDWRGYHPETPERPATTVIMTSEKYNAILAEIAGLKKDIKEMDAAYKEQIKNINNDHAREVAGLQKNIADLQKEINRLNSLNWNLKRIMRERSNAARGLYPVKWHPGYIATGLKKYEYRYTNGFGNTTKYDCWSLHMQTPYSCGIMPDEAEKEIHRDLVDVVYPHMGLTWVDVSGKFQADLDVLWDKTEVGQNFAFQESYMANLSTDVWEVDILVRHYVLVPEICKLSVQRDLQRGQA